MSERPPISPRSPRAALEPEQVPPPPKRSERARNPFVVVGNAIITILLIAMIGAIVLTLQHRVRVRRQDIGEQVARKPATSIEIRHVRPGQGVGDTP